MRMYCYNCGHNEEAHQDLPCDWKEADGELCGCGSWWPEPEAY